MSIIMKYISTERNQMNENFQLEKKKILILIIKYVSDIRKKFRKYLIGY